MRRKHPAFTPQRLSDLKGAQLMLLPPRFFITGSSLWWMAQSGTVNSSLTSSDKPLDCA